MLSPGRRIGHFEVLDQIGAGGMGVVYKARDIKLDRLVALKVLRPGSGKDEMLRTRLLREARAASSLNHPNIVTVYEADSIEGVDFIAMEFVEGEALSRRIPAGGMALPEALHVARGVAAALAVSHAAGIVHRDLKPANVMLRPDGVVKVMDFGLAKALAPAESTPEATRTMGETAAGTVLGTGPYMSPEQAEGKPVDARSDIFSFGAMLYEMLAGRQAFVGDTLISTISAVLKDQPAPLPPVPAEVKAIVGRCLEKNREARYRSGAELAAALAERVAPRRPFGAIAAGVALFLAAAGWWGFRQWRVRWVYKQAIPEIQRLSEDVSPQTALAAFQLGRRAESILPGDPALENALALCCVRQLLKSDPPGARVYYRPYFDPAADETPAGVTPVTILLPFGLVRLRMAADGYEDAIGTNSPTPGGGANLILAKKTSSPPGMVAIPAGPDILNGVQLNLPAYWLDRYETTNRQFKEFVDQGGYQKRDYWKHPVRQDGREISWEESRRLFIDATGRPGPATWDLGSFPEQQADYPVGGVSWYEAAAYAEFAAKTLPPVSHWRRAADFGFFSEILEFSNFSAKAPAPAGKYLGLGTFGTYDMAGNVREWCLNAVGPDRALLGGSWKDAAYKYRDLNAADPLERLPENGFRCARFRDAPPPAVGEPVQRFARDPGKEKPVGDDVFRSYREAFAYDPAPLDARVEGVDESSENYRREKISFAAAYGAERVIAWLFIPKNVKPPYQTVVYYPSGEALSMNSSEGVGPQRNILFAIRSGRALLHPIYKGTYERLRVGVIRGPNAYRDVIVQRGKDLRRSIDYLETRPDIDRTRLAYFGISLGAQEGVLMNAVEPRFRAAILAWGGIPTRRAPNGVDGLDFAPRVKLPVLMLSGRNDFHYPYTTSGLPLFRLLGTSEADKRMALYDVGHIASFSPEMVKEALDWLDRYLGPVKL